MQKTAEIYGLVDPRSGDIRYIGKANNSASRLKGHMRDASTRNTPVYSWIRKLRSLGMSPSIVVIETVTHDQWQASEQRVISEYSKSGKLLNVAGGGDQPYCPPDVRVENAKKAAKVRPKWIVYAYRVMEAGIRFSKKHEPEMVSNRIQKYEEFKNRVVIWRECGRIDELNELLGEYFKSIGK